MHVWWMKLKLFILASNKLLEISIKIFAKKESEKLKPQSIYLASSSIWRINTRKCKRVREIVFNPISRGGKLITFITLLIFFSHFHTHFPPSVENPMTNHRHRLTTIAGIKDYNDGKYLHEKYDVERDNVEISIKLKKRHAVRMNKILLRCG